MDLNYEKLKTISVLYVEDDPDIREELVDFLEFEVGELFVAINGEEGFKIFEEKRPDIVVTDIQMPIMNGLDMAEKIREIDLFAPIIITTAFNEPDFLIKAIDIGIDKYVTKPIDMEKLIENIYKSAIVLFKNREIDAQNKFIRFVLDKNPKFMFTMCSENLDYINKTFLNFMGFQTLNEFKDNNKSISDYILKIDNGNSEVNQTEWFEYITNNPQVEHIVYLKSNGEVKAYIVSYNRFPELNKYVFTFNDMEEL